MSHFSANALNVKPSMRSSLLETHSKQRKKSLLSVSHKNGVDASVHHPAVESVFRLFVPFSCIYTFTRFSLMIHGKENCDSNYRLEHEDEPLG